MNPKPELRIAFRVDADNLTGTGHLIEVISILQSLRKRYRVRECIVTVANEFALDRLHRITNIVQIQGGLPEPDEVREITNTLEKEGFRHLILNLLHRSPQYYGHLHEAFASTCVILDDSELREIPATCLNFSITQDLAYYERAKAYKTAYLIGPEYFLFNGLIQSFTPVRIERDVRAIFINQGGSDPFGLTAKILAAIGPLELHQQIRVVMGGALQECHQKSLETLMRDLPGNYRFHFNIPQKEMYSIMQESDMAISAAGNTLYELAFLGVPTLIISHHDKHDRVARAFHEAGAAVNMGLGPAMTTAQIERDVSSFLQDDVARTATGMKARALFDGGGTERLVDRLSAVYES